MASPTEWKHRTRVYKFGCLWFWKCCKPRCGEGGRYRYWIGAFSFAFRHTRAGGCDVLKDDGRLERIYP